MRTDIPLEKLRALPIDVWNRTWFLLSSGDFASGDHNCMTVSWGGLGTLWNKPFAMVVVRPTRYTWEFMKKSPLPGTCEVRVWERNWMSPATMSFESIVRPIKAMSRKW